jgi:hypothetical protein
VAITLLLSPERLKSGMMNDEQMNDDLGSKGSTSANRKPEV